MVVCSIMYYYGISEAVSETYQPKNFVILLYDKQNISRHVLKPFSFDITINVVDDETTTAWQVLRQMETNITQPGFKTRFLTYSILFIDDPVYFPGLRHMCSNVNECDEGMICAIENATRISTFGKITGGTPNTKACLCDEENGYEEDTRDYSCNMGK